jgi:hypothetical protein
MPYGMRSNEKGEWAFFNREYALIGVNQDGSENLQYQPSYTDLPVFTKYKLPGHKTVPESFFIELAWSKEHGVRKREDGSIEVIFFYNDETNPTFRDKRGQLKEHLLEMYFEKMKKLTLLMRA